MDALKAARGFLKAKLTRFQTYLNKLETACNDPEYVIPDKVYFELQERLNAVKPLLNDIEELSTKIVLCLVDQSSKPDEAECQYQTDVENLYFSAISTAEKLLNYRSFSGNPSRPCSPVMSVAHSNVAGLPPPSHHSNANSMPYSIPVPVIKLPTINLPKFNGELESWLEFRETFTSLIHENRTINDVQKLHYLKASLQGDASMITKSLEFSAANYKVAWDLLRERYNNSRMLVHNHFQAILDLEVLTKESSIKLRKINDNLSKHLAALDSLGTDRELLEAFLVQTIAKKLDAATAREWEKSRNGTGKDLPKLKDFKAFLKGSADLLETLETKQLKYLPKGQSRCLIGANQPCSLCKKEHFISKCADFRGLQPQARLSKAKELKLCLNCLFKGHHSSQCSSKYTCQRCKSRHHTLLHLNEQSNSSPVVKVDTNSQAEPSTATTSSIITLCTNDAHTLLPTAMAQVHDSAGNVHPVRILLDSGSQSNFIRADLCKRLCLDTSDVNVCVSGLSKSNTCIRSSCRIKVRANDSSYEVNISCLVINEITGFTPSTRVNVHELEIPDNVKLADPSYSEPGEIDILIGSPLFWNLLCVGQIRLGANLPVLQKTRFGWIVSGPLRSNFNSHVQCHFSVTSDVSESISKFWELESYPTEKVKSPEENSCELHFQEHTRRDHKGRFIVSIPYKESPEVLGDSRHTAEKRFLSLERRLQANPVLKERYVSFMKEYEDLKHMTKVKPGSEISYYLPHHGVLKETSLTTKLRVVFNGSSPTTTGISVNQIQMVGPVVQQDLFSILLRFRKYTYAISADIEKMYRQVQVEQSQRALQRILWRSSPSDPIEVYDLNTVTYGTASASFLAIRSLTQLGIDCADTHSEVSRIIQQDFYVDDLLTGSDSISQAQNICSDLSSVLKSGCFKLRKWLSNDSEVLKDIPVIDVHPVLDIGSSGHTSTLGLIWSVQTDSLMYSIAKANNSDILTKRTILSEISQIFDPLGLLGPCTISAKILLQKLWLEKISWDDLVPNHIREKWSVFREDLLTLNCLRVPRHVVCKFATDVELHGFSDASVNAYGACIYLRSTDEAGSTSVHLLCAKAKVAPLRPTTIPKLELCGTLLLSKITEQVLRSINVKISRCFLWTDSTVVLGWLKTAPNLLKPFVCNRVAEIQEITSNAVWRHVPTKTNPADLLSRGVTPQVLKSSRIWWNGPSWLLESESSWPVNIVNQSEPPELKKNVSLLATSEQQFPLADFSSFNKLRRVTAYCLRLFHNCRCNREDRDIGPLTTKELKLALNTLVKISQNNSFPNELRRLKGNKLLKDSPVVGLSPFIDSNGILRVGGRLRNSQYSFSKKHPMLISGKCHLAHLLASHEHIKLAHAGPQLMISSLRNEFWITSCRNLVKKIVHSCQRCYRFAPKLTKPRMADLPDARVQPAPPFHRTGVDYAGPLLIKDRKGRGGKTSKAYICLFICLVTKAVHIELVTDLSTQTFLLTFKRFIARRGKPLHVYSDNGTNFVGARSEMRELGKFLKNNHSDITEAVANDDITWHFIPAQSPHFGGLWEAGIKSCKSHLKRVIGLTILTFEELITLLAQIEATLNSRPLTPMSSDPNDLCPLTPAHFFIGRPLLAMAQPDLVDVKENRLSAYQRVEKFHQRLWARWSKEYISELQNRTKWRQHHSDLSKGSLVLIKEDNQPPLRWRLGRVLQVYPGPDGIARVASVLTQTGEVKRSFSKLCPLPIGN